LGPDLIDPPGNRSGEEDCGQEDVRALVASGLGNIEGPYEPVRSIVVVEPEGKIRFGHPDAADLDRQGGGKRGKNMQQRSLAMPSLDAVVEPSEFAPKCGLIVSSPQDVVVRLIRAERPDRGFVAENRLESRVGHGSADTEL
jgi:hypothetical protein